MRDRLDGCLKLWLNRGRQNHHLLRPGSGLADGETLINHFHFSLSETQIDYIKKKHRRAKTRTADTEYRRAASSNCIGFAGSSCRGSMV